MLTDPLVLGTAVSTAAVFSTTQSFARSGNDNSRSEYRFLDADSNDWKLTVGHQYGRTRNRFTMRVDLNGLVPSTAVPSENSNFSQSVYVVFDSPNSGPILNTTTMTNLDRKMCTTLSALLIGGVGADGTFLSRVVKGTEL